MPHSLELRPVRELDIAGAITAKEIGVWIAALLSAYISNEVSNVLLVEQLSISA